MNKNLTKQNQLSITNDITIPALIIYLISIVAVLVSLIVRKTLLADILVFPVYLLCVLSMKGSKQWIPYTAVVFLVFQNTVVGIGAHAFGYSSTDLTYLLQLPFLFIAVSSICVFFWEWQEGKWKHPAIEDMAFLVLIILLVFQTLASSGGISAKIVGLRNYTVFFLAFMIGRKCLSNVESIHWFFRRFVWLCVFTVLIGLIMYRMSPDGWESIGIREIYLAKKDAMVGKRMPDRFFTDFLGHEVTRLGSLYYEPVNLAYLLGSGLLTSLFTPWTRNRIKRAICSGILAVGLFFTFGKGGMMITGLAIGAYFFFGLLRLAKQGEERRTKNMLLLLLIPIIYFAGSYYVIHYNASTNPHFVGIVNTWQSVLEKPLGYGLGNGGNANLMFGGNLGTSQKDVYNNWLASGGETALMAFIYQMGIPAFIPFFLCFHGMTTRIAKGKGMGNLRYMIMMLPYILLGISIYQENTYTPQCIVPFMFLIGAMAGYDESSNMEESQKCGIIQQSTGLGENR